MFSHFVDNLKYYIGSLSTKRDNEIVLIGSWFGEKYADNSRFLYDYLSENKTKLCLKNVVWATRSKKIYEELRRNKKEVVLIGTTQSDYFHKCAGIHIICNNPVTNQRFEGDIDGRFSYRAKKINLYHGIGLKRIGFTGIEYANKKKENPIKYKVLEAINTIGFVRSLFRLPGGWSNCFYLTPSAYATSAFRQYFLLPDSHFIETGYPRNHDVSFLLEEEKRIIDKIKQYDQTIIYLPTFRPYDVDENLKNVVAKMMKIINEPKLLWIQKKHSASIDEETSDNCSENLIELDTDFDINTILKYVDLIITDFSSVFFDAYYHKKPVLFYIPDIDRYSKEGGFIRDPASIMYGPKCHDIESACEIISNCKDDFGKLISKTDYEYARKKVWGEKESDMASIWNEIRKGINS